MVHCHTHFGLGGHHHIGPQLHRSRYTGCLTRNWHVHRPWYNRFFWQSPSVCVSPITSNRSISPAAAAVATLGAIAVVAGVAMAMIGTELLPFTFAGSMTLIAGGGALIFAGSLALFGAACDSL